MNVNDEVTRLHLACDAFIQRLGTLTEESQCVEHRTLVGVAIRYLYPTLKRCSPTVPRLLGDGFEEALRLFAAGQGLALTSHFNMSRVNPSTASENLRPHATQELEAGRVGGYYAVEALRAIFRALTEEGLPQRRAALREAFDLTSKAVQCPDSPTA